MDDSEVDNLAIILGVIEGTGFDTRKNAVVIKAILGGNILETDAVIPGDVTVSFHNNLIWSTNKDAIKRMKEENQPIKLECYTKANDVVREKIGFVLVPLRSIPFWNSRKLGTMKPHWYKLHGVAQESSRSNKPELLLSITIGDKSAILNETEKLLDAESKSNVKIDNVDLLAEDMHNLRSNSDLIIERVSDDEIHLVGIENMDQYEFVVTIELKAIDGGEHFGDKINFIFTLFEKQQSEHTRDANDAQFTIGRQITVKIRSAYSDLIAYFRNSFTLPVNVTPINENEHILGSAQISFGESLSTLPPSLDEFRQVFSAKNSAYSFDNYASLSTHAGGDKVSTIHYSFQLAFVPQTSSNSDSPAHSMLPMTMLQSKNFNKKYTDTLEQIIGSVINEKSANGIETDRDGQDLVIPKTFAYTLTLIDCSFDKRPLAGIWQLSLQHPAADTPLTIRNLEISDIAVEQISFEDMHLRLCFTSRPNELFETIKSHPCILVLKGPHGVHASAELNNHNILAQEKIKGIVLLENECNEQVAMAHISVEIEELGVNFNIEDKLKAKRKRRPLQSYIDEEFAFKMIEELEEWKETQQKEFVADLKRREIAHLTQLSNEWQRKRREEEAKLYKKMEHCDRLTSTLEEAHTMFKERNRTDDEYEKTLLKTKIELERCYARKMDTLNGKVLQMEREQYMRLKSDEKLLKDVDGECERLKCENKKLRARIQTLEREIRVENDTHENTQEHINELKDYVKLLNDELEKMRLSKVMYKEKWTQMVRIIKRNVSDDSDELAELEEDYQRLNELLETSRSDLTIK